MGEWEEITLRLANWLAKHKLKSARVTVEFDDQRQAHEAERALCLDLESRLVEAMPSLHRPKINGIEIEMRPRHGHRGRAFSD